MSAHNLEIEAGRFGKHRVPRSARHCKYCPSLGIQVLGDEVHFVMICPQFQDDGKCLEIKIANVYPNVKRLNAWNKFICLVIESRGQVLFKSSSNLFIKIFQTKI